MCLPGCLFVCHLILLLVCFLFNRSSHSWTVGVPVVLCDITGS